MTPKPGWLRRGLTSLFVGALSAIAAAIALSLVNIALTGHGKRGLTDAIVSWPPLGIQLSPADMILLAIALGAAWLTWRTA